MKKSWNVNINGTSHLIEYKAGLGIKVLVDGKTHKLKTQNWFINLIDHPIMLDGTELRVVAIGNKVDLAVNGLYQGSGERYIPLNKVPSISNTLIAVSSILGFLLCGLIGMLIAVLFGQFYVKNGLEGKTGAVICSFIGCTAIQFLIMLAVGYARIAIGI